MLAQRSAAAAKEVKALIDDSVNNVDNGTRLVNQAGATMSEIVESINRVTSIMGEITVASAEQTAGIEQVNMAISQIDESTQQNAALVVQATATAQSLQDEAVALTDMVSIFKLDEALLNQPALAIANECSDLRPKQKPSRASIALTSVTGSNATK